MRVNKYVSIILVLCFIISMGINIKYLTYRQGEKQRFKLFSLTFYDSVHDSIVMLDKLIEDDITYEEYPELYGYLEDSLCNTILLLRNGGLFFDGVDSFPLSFIEMAANVISHGRSYKDTYIPPFGMDLKMATNEKAYLIGLHDYLVNIQKAIHGDDLDLSNFYLSKWKFNSLFSADQQELFFALIDEYLQSGEPAED